MYDKNLESDYIDDEEFSDVLSPMEGDILKVLNTYLTIMKYLLHKPDRRKELKKNIRKIQKIKKDLMKRDGSIKKYLDEEGQYYDLL